MVTIKTPQFQPLVENFAEHIYGIGYEVPCMNEHLQIEKHLITLLYLVGGVIYI